jgi:hypothetical protein
MPLMADTGKKPTDDEKEHIITLKDDSIYGYENVIDKVMRRKEPHIIYILRRKQFEIGTYRIRNGQTKRLTEDEINIIGWKQVMWLNITNEEAKEILGTDKSPIFGNYTRDLRKYFSKHEMSFMNLPFLFQHIVNPVDKPVQQKLI